MSFIQFLTEKNQGEIADSIGYTRSHFNVLLKKGQNEQVERLLREKYQVEIDSFFENDQYLLQEDPEEYSKSKEKFVDAEALLVHDSLLIKGMLRVILRNQAILISSQEGVPVASVLEQLTRAVRRETEAEFDEL